MTIPHHMQNWSSTAASEEESQYNKFSYWESKICCYLPHESYKCRPGASWIFQNKVFIQQQVYPYSSSKETDVMLQPDLACQRTPYSSHPATLSLSFKNAVRSSRKASSANEGEKKVGNSSLREACVMFEKKVNEFPLSPFSTECRTVLPRGLQGHYHVHHW